MIKYATLPDADVGPRPVASGFKVDISRGERIGRVSSEWFSRPDHERYLSLGALHEAVRTRAERAIARTVETRAIRVEAKVNDVSRLTLAIPGRDAPVTPTHWSFGQLCGLVSAPSGYLRQLPAPLAGINLQHGLTSNRAELVKTLEADDGRVELRVKGHAPALACPEKRIEHRDTKLFEVAHVTGDQCQTVKLSGSRDHCVLQKIVRLAMD